MTERTFDLQLVKIEKVEREAVDKAPEQICRVTLEGKEMKMTMERRDGNKIDLPLGEFYQVVFKTPQTMIGEEA